MRVIPAFLACATLAACSGQDASGPVDVVVIGDPQSLESKGVYLTPAAQHLYAATHEGLVGLDPAGQIVPAIAERWIVTEDGLSYIFRLRDSAWPDGDAITAEEIRTLLRANLRRLDGTSLGLDLAKVEQVRAMTGRVIEIRLKSPMPEFLRLLAQPEMGLVREGIGTGSMRAQGEAAEGSLLLSAMPPEERGLPARQGWSNQVRPLSLRAMPAAKAVDSFSDGSADVVLAGTLATLPLADTGPLSAGTVRLDAPLGLFGLIVRNNRGFLAEPSLREALAMSIDRTELMRPFNFGGWQSSTLIFPAALVSATGSVIERWSGLSLAERRAVARQRIAVWTREFDDGSPQVSIGLPAGPGSRLLFDQIAHDFASIGVTAIRAENPANADLVLLDRLARYYSPRWYLNQFNCQLERGLCSPEADDLVAQAISASNQTVKDRLYIQAQAMMLAEQPYIPLGQPVRWSLARGGVTGFAENQWGLHALFPLTGATI